MSSTSLRGASSFALKIIRDALLIVDHEKLLFMNRALEEMCGTSSTHVLQNPSLLFPPQEFISFFALVSRHLSGEQSSLIDAIVECQHGSSAAAPFLARVAFHPFTDDDGTRKCLCVFSEPLFYKPLFDSASALMAIMEYCNEPRDCVFLKSNGAFGKFFNITHSNRLPYTELGFRFDDTDWHFFSQTMPSEPHVRLLCIGGPQSSEHSTASSQRWIQATLTALGCSLRGRTLFTLIAEDITEMTQLKEALAQGKNLAQKQTAFFSQMVHELRTPISGMLGLTSLLRSTLMSTEQTDMLRTIQSCGDSVLALIGNILDLSNLERNRIVLQRESFNVIHCVEDALEIASSQAILKHISLCYESGPLSSEYVVGDSLRLRQMILNLLTNAIKFTPEGGNVFVRIQEKHEQSSTLYCIMVQDDGIGIAESAQAEVFQMFSQADQSIAQRFGGSGIGLAIVRYLVTLMSGTVQVQSEVGKGSTFTLLIPFERVQTGIELRDFSKFFAGKKAVVLARKPTIAANLCVRLCQLGVQIVPSAPQQEADVLFCDDAALANPQVASIVLCPYEHMRTTPTAARSVYHLPEPIRRGKLIECLCLALGIAKPHHDLEPSPSVPTRKHRRLGSPTLQRRILIVDDNIVNRKILQSFLELIGYSRAAVYTASNGLEAVESLKRHAVDVVLMDLEMPVMGGLTATAEIRKLWGNQVRIIACTATATSEQRQHCIDAGMDGFLTKPIQRESLESALGESGK